MGRCPANRLSSSLSDLSLAVTPGAATGSASSTVKEARLRSFPSNPLTGREACRSRVARLWLFPVFQSRAHLSWG